MVEAMKAFACVLDGITLEVLKQNIGKSAGWSRLATARGDDSGQLGNGLIANGKGDGHREMRCLLKALGKPRRH